MRPATRPYKKHASVRAKPSHWMPVISSRISGWRVTDSITLPKMMPMPTPAPTAPSPPPTPRAIALPASAPSSAAAKMKAIMVASTERSPLGLVVLGDGAAEVDRSQRGEDERLQGRDEADLEGEQGDAEGERDDPECLDAEEHRDAAGHEQDDQVAGEDVGEETNGERDQAHDVREELEHEHEDRHRARHPRGDEALEVAAHALRPDALDVVGDEDDQGQDERDGDVGRRRVDRERGDPQPEDADLVLRVGRQRDVADQVGEPDEEEQRADEREPLPRHRV